MPHGRSTPKFAIQRGLCPLFGVCLGGQPVFPSDLSGSMGDVIGWRSQVDHTERQQPAPWSYCYVRAIRLDRPGGRRGCLQRVERFLGGLKRNTVGGITFFGTGEKNGCAAVCELADDQHKPGTDPVPGTIKAGPEVPLEADAPAWTSSSGASSTEEPAITQHLAAAYEHS
jgi:hypothetical protein